MLRSRAEGDDDQFYSIALQVAAAEARRGHRHVANEIRAAVDAARSANGTRPSMGEPIAAPLRDLAGLLELRRPRRALSDVVLPCNLIQRLDSLVQQQRRRDWLREYGKTPNRRLLFVGPPGVGKTITAEALARELRTPLYIIRLEALITRYMGETAAKLRLIFNETLKHRALYFFDEFDAVGSRRAATNDVAEMRRLLSSFLLFLEEPSVVDSVIIGATNHGKHLDRELTRRFDDVLQFSLPKDDEIRQIIKCYIRPVQCQNIDWKSVLKIATGLSQSEIVKATEEAVKSAILSEHLVVTTSDIAERMRDRHSIITAFGLSQ